MLAREVYQGGLLFVSACARVCESAGMRCRFGRVRALRHRSQTFQPQPYHAQRIVLAPSTTEALHSLHLSPPCVATFRCSPWPWGHWAGPAGNLRFAFACPAPPRPGSGAVAAPPRSYGRKAGPPPRGAAPPPSPFSSLARATLCIFSSLTSSPLSHASVFPARGQAHQSHGSVSHAFDSGADQSKLVVRFTF